VRQKLKEVTLLEAKVAGGYEPDVNQKQKLAKKSEFEASLQKLEKQKEEIK
jgi:hypothetical protein